MTTEIEKESYIKREEELKTELLKLYDKINHLESEKRDLMAIYEIANSNIRNQEDVDRLKFAAARYYKLHIMR